MYWTCETDGCERKGLSFTGDYPTPPNCAICGQPMTEHADIPPAIVVPDGPETVVTYTADEALAMVRRERDALLTGCDWTQLSDSPLDATTKTAWATYRQQLRDLPDQAGFDPTNPQWPTPPA